MCLKFSLLILPLKKNLLSLVFPHRLISSIQASRRLPLSFRWGPSLRHMRPLCCLIWPRRNRSQSIQNSNSPINPVCLSFTWISFFILLLVLQSKHCKINHCKSIAMDSLVMLARRLSNLQILYLKDWHVRKILN